MKPAHLLLAATLVAAPLPSQAFFPIEDIITYKMHVLDCMGLLFSSEHADECGGTAPLPGAGSLVTPVTPGPAPVVPVIIEEECNYSSFLPQSLAVGERVHVAVDCYPAPA